MIFIWKHFNFIRPSLNKEDGLGNPRGSFGTLGGSRHPSRLPIGCPWATLGTAGPLRATLGPLAAPLGASWGLWEPPQGTLGEPSGAPWGSRGARGGIFGEPRGRFRLLRKTSYFLSKSTCFEAWASPRERREAAWGPWGALGGPSGNLLEALGEPCVALPRTIWFRNGVYRQRMNTEQAGPTPPDAIRTVKTTKKHITWMQRVPNFLAT